MIFLTFETDWEKLGLKVGLEIHQQLDTHKLFCNCPSLLRDDNPDFIVKRKLKAVVGETGNVDIAAIHEELKDKTFFYEGYDDTTCLVELDEEPPHPINPEALEVAIQVSKLLKMKIFDRIYIMRKTVIDGSNPTGFQRTAFFSRDGILKTSFGDVKITSLMVEEEASRKMKEENNNIYWRVDRLGIPLLEISTEPQMRTPDQVREVAEKIGLLIRMTGKVKRGKGTIRQDVNISIVGGNRVEIKGFQELQDIANLVKLEAERQYNLIRLHEKIKLRNPKIDRTFFDLKKILAKTESKLVKTALESNKEIIGIKMPSFAGLLKDKIQGERYFAKEFVDYLKVLTGISGFIHSDELPGYGITEKEISQIKVLLNCSIYDAFAFVTGEKKEVEKALNVLLDRCEQFIKEAVPSEVRFPNDDLTTKFLRPMPGAERMYPETDLLPVDLSKNFIDSIKIPETPEEKTQRFLNIGLSQDLVDQIIRSRDLNLFEKMVSMFKKVSPTNIANILLSSADEIKKRYNIDSSSLKDKHYIDAFNLLEEGKVAKEALIEILAYLAREPNSTALEAAKSLNLTKISEKELEEIIDKIIKENETLTAEKQFQILMGFVMRKVRGRIDGEIVAETLKKKLKV